MKTTTKILLGLTAAVIVVGGGYYIYKRFKKPSNTGSDGNIPKTEPSSEPSEPNEYVKKENGKYYTTGKTGLGGVKIIPNVEILAPEPPMTSLFPRPLSQEDKKLGVNNAQVQLSKYEPNLKVDGLFGMKTATAMVKHANNWAKIKEGNMYSISEKQKNFIV